MIRHLLMALVATLAGGAIVASNTAPAAAPVVTVAPSTSTSSTSTTTSTTSTTTTSTTTTTVPPPPPVDYRYPQWIALAVQVGWPDDPDVLSVLDRVIHRESRGNPDVHYEVDPNGGSRGLTQINGYWCESNKWNPDGYLQAAGVLSTCNDLFDPAINLRAALELYRHSGWDQWAWV